MSSPQLPSPLCVAVRLLSSVAAGAEVALLRRLATTANAFCGTGDVVVTLALSVAKPLVIAVGKLA